MADKKTEEENKATKDVTLEQIGQLSIEANLAAKNFLADKLNNGTSGYSDIAESLSKMIEKYLAQNKEAATKEAAVTGDPSEAEAATSKKIYEVTLIGDGGVKEITCSGFDRLSNGGEVYFMDETGEAIAMAPKGMAVFVVDMAHLVGDTAQDAAIDGLAPKGG